MGFKLNDDEPGSKVEMLLHRKHRSEDIQMRYELLYQPHGQKQHTQKELSELVNWRT
jgi:hypothetical protein